MMHAYCDESGCFTSDYQSIGIVSGTPDALDRVRVELSDSLRTERVSEIKFEKVRTNKPHLRVADGFVNSAINFVGTGQIYIDVLCWHIKDSRHATYGRDDTANLERMYYKILRSLAEKWKKVDWAVFPDEGNAYSWDEIRAYLNNTKIFRKPDMLTLFELENVLMRFHDVAPQESIKEPLIQLADLFAGMTCFSIANKAEYKKWFGQYVQRSHSMLWEDPERDEAICTMKNRFNLIQQLYERARRYKLGVSLQSEGYLRTFRRTAPLRYWHYKPVNEYDKAPKRTKH